MSFHEFKAFFNRFAQELASANALNDDKRREAAMETFRSAFERWALRVSTCTYTSMAIQICNFMDPTFEPNFIDVIKGYQAKNHSLGVELLLREVIRLSDPANMLKELEQKAYYAICAQEQAKQQFEHANEARTSAIRELEEFKQRRSAFLMHEVQMSRQEPVIRQAGL